MSVLKGVRLVGCDMDGTLLTSKRDIDEYSLRVIERLISHGIQFAAVTGRPLFGLPKQLGTIPGFRYCVLANGACVYDRHEGCVISESVFSDDVIQKIEETVSQFQASMAFMADGMLYVPDKAMDLICKKYAHDQCYLNMFTDMWKVTTNVEEVFKKKRDHIQKYNIDFLDMDTYRACLLALENIPEVEISCNSPRYIELTARGYNKGNGLELLARHLGLKVGEVMVMGDSDNDRSMFTEDRVRVAVQNAEQGILNLADYITLDHDEHGVAYALESLLLGDKSADRLICRRKLE